MKTVNNGLRVIVGLGKTGLSVAYYCQKHKIPFALTDTRSNPPNIEEVKSVFPDVVCRTGSIDQHLISQAEEIIVSPGIDANEDALKQAREKKIPIVGDVELFARNISVPICAITGSNGKSTVTNLVNIMANHACIGARMGGNVGIPVLDLLSDYQPNMYILELSSFQLDTTFSLCPEAAAILNVTPDHLDRYKTFQEYVKAKQWIYHNAANIIYNRDDTNTYPQENDITIKITFGLNRPEPYHFGIVNTSAGKYLTFGEDNLISVNELLIKGQYNWANALAALALGYAMKIPMLSMLQALSEFKGLSHRCEFVTNKSGVSWYNDSKGTNVGATYAAIESVGENLRGKVILLAGGLAKGQDFAPLQKQVARYVKKMILFGEDAPIIAQTLADTTAIESVKDIADAINIAKTSAEYGDAVLLSPACASFDMFKDYQERGDIFKAHVKELLLGVS